MKTSKVFLLALFLATGLFSVLLVPLFSVAEESELVSIQEEAKKGGYKLIDVDSLWQLYQEDKDNLVIVDTRQEREFHSGFIQGALNFPFEQTWLSRLTSRGAFEQFLGPDKHKTFVFY